MIRIPPGTLRHVGYRLPAVIFSLALVLTGMAVVHAASNGGKSVSITIAGGGLSISPGTCPTSGPNACSLLVSVVQASKQKTYFLSLAPYTVEDDTGSGSGWHVSFQASTFACVAPFIKNGGCNSGYTVPAGSLTMAAPTAVTCTSSAVTCATPQASLPTITLKGSTTLDTTGGSGKVASAALNKGMGRYTFTPGVLQCGAADPTSCANSSGGAGSSGQLALTIPASAKTGSYSATLTETVISGP
jgi:hypothetical protein